MGRIYDLERHKACVVHVLEKVYETGMSLTKKELKPYLSKLKRSLTLPKWDVCIGYING